MTKKLLHKSSAAIFKNLIERHYFGAQISPIKRREYAEAAANEIVKKLEDRLQYLKSEARKERLRNRGLL